MSAEFIAELKQKLDHYQEVYNNTGDELISDDEFDAMVRCYEDLSGSEYKAIGAKSREEATPLPRFSPSLNKIKDKHSEKELENFLARYEGNLIDLDKFDGISLFVNYIDGKIVIQKRGDGVDGPDISFIQNYISFPKIPFNVLIRGELVMFESDLDEIREYLISKGKKASNSRSVVNGATSNLNTDEQVISKCKFIPYGIYELPANPAYNIVGGKLRMSEQLVLLKQWGFFIPEYVTLTKEQCKLENLISYLKYRREKAEYRIDGTVLIFDIPIDYPLENKNPDYAVAIKQDTIKFTTITGCNWNLTSKDGYLTPVITVEPVTVVTTVNEITLHNGRMVLVNKLGVGDYIAITQGGDIIPKFLFVVRSAPEPKLIFCPSILYQWNSRGVEILVIDPMSYPQVKCARMKYFLDRLKVKKLGLLTIMKLYESGITNIGKLIRASITDLMEAESLQERGSTGIYEELQKCVKAATMPSIMAGSCIFGEGLSSGLMKDFIKEFPNWKTTNITYEEILSKKGFGPSRAKAIADNLPEFKIWLSQIPELEGKTIQQVIKNNVLAGKVFCFSKFTSETAVEQIRSYGGEFYEKERVATNVVVAKDLSKDSIKINFARKEIEAATREGRQPKVMLISQLQLENELSRIRLETK